MQSRSSDRASPLDQPSGVLEPISLPASRKMIVQLEEQFSLYFYFFEMLQLPSPECSGLFLLLELSLCSDLCFPARAD